MAHLLSCADSCPERDDNFSCYFVQKMKELLNIICSVYLVDKCPCVRYNMDTFKKGAAQMRTMETQFQNAASRASGRLIPELKLAGLRVAILRLLPIIRS